ncbi:hypothetical protein K7J14_13100 [Treponema zuelzerae]|uniref:Uncharacterized protein n=1 Tax=Teretinema zuelzerae TaxID=156 RepID=A0AAE3JKV5_9SPIR|nr:hypothetical protein [Teretinema zuelzerae]MCD1655630.1 hypothetical protein [Teretinema zuelzerae]
MKNMKSFRYICAFAVCVFFVQTGAWGAIFTWDGSAADGLWNTAANWTLTDNTVADAGLDGIPNGVDSARIPLAQSITTGGALTVQGITFTAGATLTLGGNLTINGDNWDPDNALYLESTGITINLGGNDITAGKTHFGLDNQCGLTVNGAGNFTTNTVDTRQTANNSLLLYSDARFKITSGGYLDHTTGSMLFSGDSSSSIDLPTGFTAPAPTNVTIENLQILVAGVSFSITATPELTTGLTSVVNITGSFTDTQTFFFTATVTDAGVTTNESYTINGTAYTDSVAAKTALGTPAAGTPNTFSRNITIPATVDAGDGILIQFYMSASYLPIGSVQYVQAGKEWTNNGGTGDGFWATAVNWDPAGVPTGTDIVTIPSGGTPTIAAGTTATAKRATVQTGATLTFGNGSTLNADKINNNGTVILEGSATLPSTRTNGLNSTIEYAGAGTPIWGSTYENLTINASGTITATSALVVNEDLAVTAGTLTAQGNLSVSGALSISGAGSANFNAGAGAQATSANSVSFSTTGTVGLGNDSGDSFAATTGNLALGGAASFALAGTINAGGTITLGENASLAADTVFSKAAALTGSVNMTTGGNDLTLTGGFDCDGNTITLTGGGTLNNPVSIAVGTGTLNFADGTLAGAGSVSISTGTLKITGTAASLTVTDNSIINMQGAITTLTVSGGVPTVTGTGTGLTIGGNPGGAISTDGTVTITGTAFTDITNSGTLTISNAATLSGNLVVTAGSVSASSTLGVGGNVEIELGTTLNIGGVLTVTGNWTDNGATFTHNLNGVVFTPAALGTSTITGDTDFADLTCANQGGETLSIAGDIGVTGTLTLSGTGTADRLIITGAGSIDLTAPQTTGQYLLVDPDINIATSTYTAYSSRASGTPPAGWVLYASANGSPVTWTGAGINANWDNPDNWGALAVPGSVDEVVIPNIGPSTNYPVANVAVNAAEITVDANAEFTGNGQSINATGDFSNSGTVRLVGTESIAIGGTTTNVAGSTVEYNGTGSAVWPNDAYQNLTITAAGVVSLGTDAVTVAGTLLNEGEINVNGTGSINTSDAANGTFRYSGTDQPVPTLDGYNNLIIDCTGDATAGGDITVGGDLTLTTGTLVMGANGLTAANISGGSGITTSGVITATGTITTLNATTGATLNGGAGLTITNAIAGNPNLTLTGSITLNGAVGTISNPGTLTLNGSLTSGAITNTGTVAVGGQELTAASISGGLFRQPAVSSVPPELSQH